MITPKRPTDYVSFALHVLVRELREPIVRQLEVCYGCDCLELGILPALPEYALRQNWSRTELLKSDDPVIWLKLLQHNWRQAFAAIQAAEREGDAMDLLRLRNKAAHTNEINEGNAAEAMAALERLLTAFARPMPADFQAVALECRLLGWSCVPAPCAAASSPAQPLPISKPTMPISTTAAALLALLVREQPRTRLDLVRTKQCPPHERWVFFNSRDYSQYVVRTDQRPRPWPDYWHFDSLRKVQLDPVPLQLALTKDYETAHRRRVRDLSVNVWAEVQLRDDADAARKIALDGEPEVQSFLQLLGSALLTDLAARHLEHDVNHGRYSASDRQAAVEIARTEIPADCPFRLVRLLEFTFGDPVHVQQSRELDIIDQEAERTITKIKAEQEIFVATEPLVDAQHERALKHQRHEGTRKAIEIAIAELPRRLRQENISSAFRQIKELNLNEKELLLYAGQLDPESLHLVLEHQRLNSRDHDAMLEQLARICERLGKSVQPRNYYH